MDVLQVIDELRRINPVPVQSNDVDGTIPATCGKEILQPGLSSWCIRRCRRTQPDTLRLERLQVSLPEFRTLLCGQVRLASELRPMQSMVRQATGEMNEEAYSLKASA